MYIEAVKLRDTDRSKIMWNEIVDKDLRPLYLTVRRLMAELNELVMFVC